MSDRIQTQSECDQCGEQSRTTHFADYEGRLCAECAGVWTAGYGGGERCVVECAEARAACAAIHAPMLGAHLNKSI